MTIACEHWTAFADDCRGSTREPFVFVRILADESRETRWLRVLNHISAARPGADRCVATYVGDVQVDPAVRML